MRDPEHLWSPYGLRSLSASHPLFGQGENYWRGPIWIHMNYMALSSLYKVRLTLIWYVENLTALLLDLCRGSWTLSTAGGGYLHRAKKERHRQRLQGWFYFVHLAQAHSSCRNMSARAMFGSNMMRYRERANGVTLSPVGHPSSH